MKIESHEFVINFVSIGHLAISKQTFQRCLNVAVRLISRREFGQRQINVECVDVKIYNVEQRRISVDHFNIDTNNVRQQLKQREYDHLHQNISELQIKII